MGLRLHIGPLQSGAVMKMLCCCVDHRSHSLPWLSLYSLFFFYTSHKLHLSHLNTHQAHRVPSQEDLQKLRRWGLDANRDWWYRNVPHLSPLIASLRCQEWHLHEWWSLRPEQLASRHLILSQDATANPRLGTPCLISLRFAAFLN